MKLLSTLTILAGLIATVIFWGEDYPTLLSISATFFGLVSLILLNMERGR